MITNREALVERLVNGEMERAAEIGVADQHDRGEGLTVHLVAEQQAQLFEHGLGQEMRFVEDNDGGAMFVGIEVIQGGTDAGRRGAGLLKGGSTPSCSNEVTIQARLMPVVGLARYTTR